MNTVSYKPEYTCRMFFVSDKHHPEVSCHTNHQMAVPYVRSLVPGPGQLCVISVYRMEDTITINFGLTLS